MTDEMSAVLAGLTPTVVPVAGADPELIAIGERYWAMAGFHPELFTPVWCEKAADIDTLGWGGPLYATAAGGVRAVVDHMCPQCQQQLSLTSRTALADLARGETPVCVECTESLVAAVQTLNDPKRKAKRDAARARAAEQQALDAALATWQSAQHELIEERYRLTFSETVPTASVREMVAALALLRYAPSTTPISQIGAWLDPLHPAQTETVQLLGALVRGRLIRIHPTTPVTAIEWKSSFQDALAAAGGDLESVELSPQPTSNFFPLDSRFYAPFATSAGTGAQHLDAALSERLTPEHLTAGQHDDLLSLAQELIAEEALRYFTSRLEDLNLPTVTDNHVERLREAAYKVARHRPLAEIYNLAWRSTRSAAESAQKNPRAPRANMSTHAVNQFETHALHAVTDPAWPIKAFGEVTGCGPSAMARTLFYTVLDMHPLETSLTDIEQALPEPAPEPPTPAGEATPQPPTGKESEDEELSLLVRWLHAYPESWDPDTVLKALEDLAQSAAGMEYDVEQRVVRRAVAHLQQLKACLSPVLDERQVALAVLAATELLQHPVTGSDRSAKNQPVGSVVRRHLSQAIFGTEDDPAEE
ncbi:hypothetical protein GCM10009647_026600 [Streptomyces sanglieri]|uniref:Uncharacterized protein n=1 Tax=Streptomyces sanglieri TaxID=193460 RepID=A0ABW2WM76_9ACTN